MTGTRSVTPALRQDLQILLSERRAGWSVYGSASPHGEETAKFFDAWPDIAKCLGIRPSRAKYKAIAKMWDLLQALYSTYQAPRPLNCADVAPDFRRHCTVGTASWYLLSLEHDVDTMLQNIKPFGLAMFSGDISESINRFLKHGHNEHSNRGEGGGCRAEGVDEVSGRRWLAIHREANVQAQCMTWFSGFFDVSWVVHGGPRSQVPCSGRDAMEVRRHSRFQVVDASAIEGFRGLAVESSSIYSCVQIYKALTPPPSPPQRIAARRKDLGLRPMWNPMRSVPAQIAGYALPHPRPQMQVRLCRVGRSPLPMTALAE